MNSRDRTESKEEQKQVALRLLELCEMAYRAEMELKAEMEKKAQFYFALLTGLIGVFVLDGKFSDLGVRLADLGGAAAQPIRLRMYIFFGLMAAALFCVLQVMRPRRYEQAYPSNLLTHLYRVGKDKESSEVGILRARAEEFAFAVDVSSFSNIEKSRWLLGLAVSVVLVLLCLTFMLMVTP